MWKQRKKNQNILGKSCVTISRKKNLLKRPKACVTTEVADFCTPALCTLHEKLLGLFFVL